MIHREPEVVAADNWWDSLTPRRKVRLHRWLSADHHKPTVELPGQQPLDGMPKRPRRRDHRGRFAKA
jgi:hypothetical protein